MSLLQRVLLLILLLISSDTYSQYDSLINKIDNLRGIERSIYFLGSLEKFKTTLKDNTDYINQVEKLALKTNDNVLLKEARYLKKLTSIETDNSKIVGSLIDLLKYYKSTNSINEIGYIYHTLAQIYFSNQEHVLAFEYYYKAYSEFEKVGFEKVPPIGKFLHDFALANYYFKKYDKVIELMHIAKKYPYFNKNHHQQLYNNMAVSFMKLNQLDSAVYYFHKTSEIAHKYNSNLWKALVSGKLGEVYLLKDKPYTSLKYFISSCDVIEKSEFSTLKYSLYLNLSKTYLLLDSVPKSKYFIDKAKNLMNTIEPHNFGDSDRVNILKSDFFSICIDYYRHTNQYKEALIYNDSLVEVHEKLSKMYDTSVVKMTEEKLRLQENELKIHLQKEKSLNNKILFFGLVTIVFLFTIILLLFYNSARLKKKRINEKLIAENTITKLEKENLAKEIESARSEINIFIKKINEQNERFVEIESLIATLEDGREDDKLIVQDSVNALKSATILTNEDWVQFQYNFQKLYSDFTKAIKAYNPPFTNSEIRYLMLVKLGLSNKEMTRVLGVSDGAIRVTWNRVKKKLNCSSEDTPKKIIEELFSL